MRAILEQTIQTFMNDYLRDNSLPDLWKAPRLRLGDARHPRLRELPGAVLPDHFMPDDFLPGATTIVSYFVPFQQDVGNSNRDGREASDLWGVAYRSTNDMAAHLNPHLAAVVQKAGFRAAVPENIGFTPEVLMSRWSQRHIAWLSGHGTFGVNNMLITDIGCCGRYFSIVTDMPATHDDIVAEEHCGYKRNGSCLACVKRCVNGALQADSFDRHLCFKACNENAPRQQGDQICGKCVTGVPCSFRKM